MKVVLKLLQDWKLMASISLLALIAVMSCDTLNNRVSNIFAPPAQAGPNVNTWKEGTLHEVGITLITKDMDRLQCADDREFEGAHCAYGSDEKRRMIPVTGPADDNLADTLQPYRTAIGNQLVLIAGLWHTPAVALRRHQEPPQGVADKDLKRFVAQCKLRFLGSMDDVSIRWNPTAKWYKEKFAPVARAEWCEIPRNEDE